MDDIKGRISSELAGLRPIGNIRILMNALKNHALGFDQFLDVLRTIVRPGFYFTQ